MTAVPDLHEDLERSWQAILDSISDPPQPEYEFSEAAASTGFPLDPYQDRAAHHLAGPIRVLAPAGSGKTRTLTARITRMISGGIPAERILALAFNTRAAEEMAERLTAMVPGTVQTRTFHSLGYEIVRELGAWRYDPSNETRVRELAEAAILRSLTLPTHPGERRRRLATAHAVLVRAKSRLTPYVQMTVMAPEGELPLGSAFKEWVSDQRRQRLLTFSDMIYFALCGLAADSALRGRWQRRFDFILVDEFQDLNAAQMLFLRILALPQNNLFVVGDDDQLIYAWRDAEESHILDFEGLYPGAETVILATNYRSGRKIVRHGRWLIENNPARVEKDIRPSGSADRGRVDIVLAPTPAGQARAAVDWIRERKAADALDWSAFGLLFRINKDAEPLEEVLVQAGIPFATAGSVDPEPEEPPEIAGGMVTLMTIHKSKGKEFPYVVYFNLSRGTGTALDEPDERRVAYVGVTRAGRGLLVTSEAEHPSPFLVELALNPDLDDFAEPFLARLLAGARRESFRKQRDWRGWLSSFFSGSVAGDLESNAPETVEEIDLLETELRFRHLLGIEKKP